MSKRFFSNGIYGRMFGTKFGTVKFTYGLHFCLTATNNFRSLTEAIAISILKYLNGKLLLWYTSNIIIYLLLCVRPFLRNFSHFQILLKIGAIRRLYFN